MYRNISISILFLLILSVQVISIPFNSSNAQENIFQERSQSIYLKAVQFFKQKKYTKSKYLLEKYLLQKNTPQQKDKASFLLARVYYESKNFNKALSLFQAYQNQHLFIAYQKEILYWIGLSLYQIKNYKDSINNFIIFIQTQPHASYLFDAYYFLGLANAKLNHVDDAIIIFKEAIHKYDNLVLNKKYGYLKKEMLQKELGKLYCNIQKYLLCRKTFKNLILKSKTHNLNFLKYYLWLGKSYYFEKNYKQALNHFKLISSYKKDILKLNNTLLLESLYYKALVFYKQNKVEQAKQELLQILANKPHKNIQNMIYYYVGLILYEQEKYKKAVQYLNKAIIKIQDNHYKNHGLEIILAIDLKQNRLKKSVMFLDNIINKISSQSEPDVSFLTHLKKTKAFLLFRLKEFKKALKIYTELLNNTTTLETKVEYYFFKAQIFYVQHQWLKVLQNLEQIKKTYEKNDYLKAKYFPHAFFLKAETHQKLEQYSEALKDYFIIIKQYPQYSKYQEVQESIAWIYFKLNQFLRAKEYFQIIWNHIDKNKKNNIHILLYIAICEYNLKDYNSALKHYGIISKETAVFTPVNEESIYYKAKIYFETKQYRLAIKEFQSYFKIYKDTSFYLNALYLYSWCYFYIQNYGYAIKFFQKTYESIVKKNDLKVISLLKLAQSYYHNKDHNNAFIYLQIYESSYKKHQAFSIEESLYLKVKILLSQKKPKQAWNTFKILEEKIPHSIYLSETIYELINYYKKKKKYLTVRKLLDYILKKKLIKPEEEWITKLDIVNSFLKEKKMEEAKNYLTIILNQKDEDHKTYHQDAFLKLIDIHYHEKNYQKVLSLIKKYPYSHWEISLFQAKAYLKVKKYNESEQVLLALEKQFSENINYNILYYLGLVYYEKELYQKAHQYLMLVQKNKNFYLAGECNFYLGEMAFKEDQWEKALKYYLIVNYNYSYNSKILELTLYRIITISIKLHVIKKAKKYFTILRTNFPQSTYIKTLKPQINLQ